MEAIREADWGSACKQACCNQGTISGQAARPKGEEQRIFYCRPSEGSRQRQARRRATGSCSTSSIWLHTLDQGAAYPCIMHISGSSGGLLLEQHNHLSPGQRGRSNHALMPAVLCPSRHACPLLLLSQQAILCCLLDGTTFLPLCVFVLCRSGFMESGCPTREGLRTWPE